MTESILRMDVFVIIEQSAAEVTEAQVVRWGSKLDDPRPEEEVWGEVGRDIRPLWVLFNQWELKSRELVLQAESAESEVEEERVLSEASRLMDLSDIAKHLFFFQAELDLGGHVSLGVGLRSKWRLVKFKEHPLQRILGGALGR